MIDLKKTWAGWTERSKFFDVTCLEFSLALFFSGAFVFFLALTWTILFGGGLEYAVKIGK